MTASRSAQVTATVVRAAVARHFAVFAFESVVVRQLFPGPNVGSSEKDDVIRVVYLDDFGVHVRVAAVIGESRKVSLKRAIDDGVVVLF